MAVSDLITDHTLKQHGLVRSKSSDLCWYRRRRGKGFSYHAQDGDLVADSCKQRLIELAVPPVYEQVVYSCVENGHLQATGQDTTGSCQYFYHAHWQTLRDTYKFERLTAVAQALPSIRRKVRRCLKEQQGSKTRALAACVRVLNGTGLRVGNSESANSGTYGISTLQRSHLCHEDGQLVLSYTAKAGAEVERVLSHSLAELLRELETLGTSSLFEYKGAQGDWVGVSAAQVNQFLAELHDVDMTAKEFRTFRASSLFVKYWMQKGGASMSLTELLEKVASQICNTPATLRSSYIHPALIEKKKQGMDLSTCEVPNIRGLKKHERLMLELI